MRIALDFDDTITADPNLWFNFVQAAKQAGHEVRIVTFRNNNGHWSNQYVDDFAKACSIDVIYTEAQPKRNFCANVGFFPDVWIDDKPEWI